MGSIQSHDRNSIIWVLVVWLDCPVVRSRDQTILSGWPIISQSDFNMKLSSSSWEVTAEGRESAKRCSLCSKPCARDSKHHNDFYLHSLVLQKWMSRYPEKKTKILTSQFNDHIQKLNQPTGITYVVNYNLSNAHLWALASTFLLAWLEKKMWISVCVCVCIYNS